jgi:PBP1b-binding outer membrane lipoprotein LpoB
MKKLQLLLTISFLISFIFSCSKTEVLLKNELLTTNTWRLQKVTEIRNAKATVLFEKGINAIIPRDDFNKVRMSFLVNGTVNFIDGNNVLTTGTWALKNNENQIEMKRSNSSKTYILYIDKLEDKVFNCNEKESSNSVQYEFIPE